MNGCVKYRAPQIVDEYLLRSSYQFLIDLFTSWQVIVVFHQINCHKTNNWEERETHQKQKAKTESRRKTKTNEIAFKCFFKSPFPSMVWWYARVPGFQRTYHFIRSLLWVAADDVVFFSLLFLVFFFSPRSVLDH